MNCPSCDESLHPGTFGEAEVHLCPGCMGTLVAQRHLVPLMETLSADLQGQIDFDHPIDRAEQAEGPFACPKCSGALEAFGYMETNLVRAWRCGRDWVVWADPEALGVMSVLYARTKMRRETRESQEMAQLEALNRRVTATLRARMRSDLVASGLLTGLPG